MSFTNYIWYLLTMAKRSLTSGLQAFVKELDVSWDSYSKQAFSQGRQRIKLEAIKALMSATQERFYQEANYATWKGMRVLTIDGSRYNLPTSEELREHYGIQKSSGELLRGPPFVGEDEEVRVVDRDHVEDKPLHTVNDVNQITDRRAGHIPPPP